MQYDDTPAAAPLILADVPPPTVVALFGPTGVGKTAVAIALADRLRADGEDPVAVSADALQIYRGLETLTGAASAAEQARLEHRLLSFLPVDAPFSAGQYAHRAHAEIDALLAAGRRPIVVGGTGLYLRAALAELDLRPPVPAAVRERRRTDLRERGAAALHAELAERDAAAAAAVRPTDTQRLVRALELLDAGHAPPAGPQLWTADTRHPTLLAGLTMEREALKARIDDRVRRDGGRRRGRRGPRRRGRRRLAHGPQGARLPGAAGRRRRGDADAARAATPAASSRGCASSPDVLLLDTTGPRAGAGRGRAARRPGRPRGMILPCASRSGRPSATTT